MKQIINKILLIAIFLMGGSTMVSAQSLEELINLAIEQNYDIKILKNEAAVAANNNTKGNAGKLPTIDLSGGVTSSFNSTKQKFSDGTERTGNFANNTNINSSILLNWTAFDGFRVQARKEQLELLEQLSDMDVKFYVEQTVSDVTMAYYQLLYEKQLLANFQESLSISAFRLSIAQKRKDVGGGKAVDYGQALVDYQTDSIRLLGQLNTIQSLEIELNRLLNNDLEHSFELTESDFSIQPLPSKDTLLTAIKNNNKQLQQERLLELISETTQRLAKADRYPKIDLFGGAQYTHSFSEVGLVESSRNIGPLFGLNISFNLYNGGETKRLIENADIYRESAQLSREQVNHNIDANVLDLYHQYVSVSSRIALANNNIEAMKKVYETTSEQLKQGAINGFDFRTTQLSLLNTELTLIQLQFALKAIEININRLSGSAIAAYL
ncbi:MAG: TolC family protein [Bacteroidetes bacterium]|nr:TolC family protein [Bacteroidota bacterium]